MKKFLSYPALGLLVILASACSAPLATPDPATGAQDSAAPAAQSSPTSSPTTIPTATPTPIPGIQPENAAQVTELDRLGKGVLTDVSFSPDGTTLAVASTIGIQFYDAATQQPGLFIPGKWVHSMAYSPDSTRLAAALGDRSIRVWDSASGAELYALTGLDGLVTSLAYSPDGQMLASASSESERVQLWQAADGLTLDTQIEYHGELAFSPDGRVLASGATLWDVSNQTRIMELDAGISTQVAYASNGHYLATWTDRHVVLWDVATESKLNTYCCQDGNFDLAFSPDSTALVSSSYADYLLVYDLSGYQADPAFQGHDSYIKGVAFSPDGSMLASISADKTVRLWDSKTGSTLAQIDGYSTYLNALALSPDDVHLASGDTYEALVWDLQTGTAQSVMQASFNQYEIEAIAYSPDGRFLAAARDGYQVGHGVTLYDAASLEALQTFVNVDGSGALAFSPDSQTLAVAADGSDEALGCCGDAVYLEDVQTGEARQILNGHTNSIQGIAFSPDGTQLATAAWDRTVLLWSVGSGELLHSFDFETNDANSLVANDVSFSPDGSQLAVALGASSQGEVQVFDATSYAHLQTFGGYPGEVTSVAYSPNGLVLAAGGYDGTLWLWNVQNGEQLISLAGHTAAVQAIAWAADGTWLASASTDGTIRIWGLPAGE